MLLHDIDGVLPRRHSKGHSRWQGCDCPHFRVRQSLIFLLPNDKLTYDPIDSLPKLSSLRLVKSHRVPVQFKSCSA